MLLGLGSRSPLVLRAQVGDASHIRHFGRLLVHVLLLLHLLLLHLKGLRVLLVLVLSPRFFLSIKHHQLLCELLIFHAELLPDLDQTSKAVHVVRILIVNVLIYFKRLVEQVHASVATSNHKTPFVLLWLDLLRSLKINNSFFKHVVLCMMHAETADHVDLRRVVSIRLLVEMNSLELISFLLIQVAHLCQDF